MPKKTCVCKALCLGLEEAKEARNTGSRSNVKIPASISLYKELIWPTVFAMPALAVLLSLGAWQWQRKTWKEDLLQQLEMSQVSEPATLSSLMIFNEPDDIRFRRLSITGTFLHDKEIHIWSPGQQDGQPTSRWRVITPFALVQPADRTTASIPSHILIIRGNVDNARKQYITRPEENTSQATQIIGRVRFDSANWATPDPDLEANVWYALENGRMSSVLRQSLPAATVAPFFVEAEAAMAPRPAPQPDLKQLALKNRHLEYAVTWWGLALTLVGVYAAFAARIFRQAARLS